MISVKVMDLNIFIDVFSMLLRCLNLADGLHATHIALILKLPKFRFVSMSNYIKKKIIFVLAQITRIDVEHVSNNMVKKLHNCRTKQASNIKASFMPK